jgi:hypothetical protein
MARSGVTLFMTLFGILVFLHTHGIDIFRLRTIVKYRGYALLGLVLTILTMAAPFILPETFRFVPPTPAVWLLLLATFGVTAATLNIALHNRHLLNRLKQLGTS